MPRPKGSKNKAKVPTVKYTKAEDIKVQLPLDVDKYELKQIYQLLLNMRKKLEVDPTAIKPSEYIGVLEKYTEKVRAYKVKKWGKKQDVRPGMDSRTVAQVDDTDVSAVFSGKKPPSMGTGI